VRIFNKELGLGLYSTPTEHHVASYRLELHTRNNTLIIIILIVVVVSSTALGGLGFL
jgi:hypothetical protein